MTVKELMEVLSKLDQDKEVTVWNYEYTCRDPIDEVEVNRDGNVTIY